MYVSFADLEFDGDVDKAVEGIKANWAEMKRYVAVNNRIIVTGENTLRTMTLWSSTRDEPEYVYTGWTNGHSIVSGNLPGESGMPAPDYVKCKESLVTQIVTRKCPGRSSGAGSAAEMNGNAS